MIIRNIPYVGPHVGMAAAAVAFAAGLASGPAFASGVFPSGVTVVGDFMYAQGTIQSPDYLQGQYRNGTYSYLGSGPTPLPVNGADGATLSFGGPGNSLTLHPTISPNTSLTVAADASLAADPHFPASDIVARGDLDMTYSVVVRANSQAAADAFSALLNTSGAIANIAGTYDLSETGDGWGSVGAFTGASGLADDLKGTFFAGCSITGYQFDNTLCNKSLVYSAPLNFIASSDGNPLDFVSQIELAVDANAGPYDLGYTPGKFTAFIDPTILFSSALKPGDYSLEVGGLAADFVNAPAGGVPEPANWVLMITGLLGLGAALRRTRASLASPV